MKLPGPNTAVQCASLFVFSALVGGGCHLKPRAKTAQSAQATSSGQPAQQDFTSDVARAFDCRIGPVDIKEVAYHRYSAAGCSRTATYDCSKNGCATTMGKWWDQLPIPKSQEAHREQAKTGQNRVLLQLLLDSKTMLELSSAATSTDHSVRLVFTRMEETADAKDCSLDWLVNGERLNGPKTVRENKNYMIERSAELSRAFAEELGGAESVALRVCDTRWSLTPPQVTELRHFSVLYNEELAWSGAPREEGSGGRLPPTGGWPKWSAGTAPPGPLATKTLDATALYRQLAPSIFQVRVESADGNRLGSAVAVSKTEVLTNCHVVEGARKITLKQDKNEWPATIVRSHPKSDRCVLSLAGVELVPIAGVRAYDDLAVGEALYTLGSPNGLELSLSNGILSGRREEDGRHYIQTTAPISPGSSGGGLFDARGNLVGITTLVLAGRERLNQALNFAIPADSFFKP